MIVNVPQLDLYIAMLRGESARLHELGKPWAHNRAEQFDEIRELLRQLRQEKQMQGPTGRIE